MESHFNLSNEYLSPDDAASKIEVFKHEPEHALQLLIRTSKTFNRCHSRRADQNKYWSKIIRQLEVLDVLPTIRIAARKDGVELSEAPLTRSWSSCTDKRSDGSSATSINDFSGFIDTSRQILKDLLHKTGQGFNGNISIFQLGKAVEDPSIKGAQARALAALYANFKYLQHLNSGKNGISVDVLAQLKEHQVLPPQYVNTAITLRRLVREGLWNDSWMSKRDVDRALKHANLSYTDKHMLKFILTHFNEIAAGRESEMFVSTDCVFKYEFGKKLPILRAVSLIRSHLKYAPVIGQMSRRLYTKNEPALAIQPRAVGQGNTGDCYFEAGLTAVAASNPNLIYKSIRDNHNGTYTINFEGYGDVTVNAPTDTELYLYNRGNWTGTWSSVVEKAFGKIMFQRAQRVGINFPTPQDAAAGEFGQGGDPAYALKVLTGKTYYRWLFTDMQSDRSIQQRLLKSFDDSGNPLEAVVASTSDITYPKLLSNHSYAVIGIERKVGKPLLVLLMNPIADYDQVQPIPWEVFRKEFNDVAFPGKSSAEQPAILSSVPIKEPVPEFLIPPIRFESPLQMPWPRRR